MKFEIYERLNTGSISLNAQELRNSIYRGSFNDLLHELTNSPSFRALMGTKTARKRMVDEEAILRFFAMREHLRTYRAPLKKFLNDFMSGVRNASAAQIDGYRKTFVRTVDTANALLGDFAFRVLGPNGAPSELTINRSLIEAQLLACSWIDGALPASHAVKHNVAALFQSEAFMDAVQRATGDRSRTLKRARDTVAAIEDAGAQMQIPFDLQQ